MTCRTCHLTISTPTDRTHREPGHELVWRTVNPGVEVPHFLLHNPA